MRSQVVAVAIISAIFLPPFVRFLKSVVAVELCGFSLAANHLWLCQPKDVSPIKFGTFIESQVNFTEVASLAIKHHKFLSQSEFTSKNSTEFITQIER